jgi:hypothetical protein
MTDWNFDMASAPKDRPVLIWSEQWSAEVYNGGENRAAVCTWRFKDDFDEGYGEGKRFYVQCSNYYAIWATNPIAWAEVSIPDFSAHPAQEASQ